MTQTERDYVAVDGVVDALSNAENVMEVQTSLREIFSAIRAELVNKELSHLDACSLVDDWLYNNPMKGKNMSSVYHMTHDTESNELLGQAAQSIIDAVDQPKMVKPPLKPERLYIQVVSDDSDAWQKRAFLCHGYVDGNLAELFASEDYSLREVVEFVSAKLGCPVNVE